jgi:hypothetical protein
VTVSHPVQEFFAIGDVCQMTDLKPHVLRYWESQFRFQRIDEYRRTGQLKSESRSALQHETIQNLRAELRDVLDVLDVTKPLAATDQ